MLSDAACAHDAQKIFGPLSLSAFGNASRAQAATSSNCEPLLKKLEIAQAVQEAMDERAKRTHVDAKFYCDCRGPAVREKTGPAETLSKTLLGLRHWQDGKKDIFVPAYDRTGVTFG